jgi:hypothetical protein
MLFSSQDCIGAIDDTHVTAGVPKSRSATYRGTKHYTSQNVLAVVDFDLKFTYVLAGWEGSAHDACILADSLNRPDDIHLSDNKFYLGDAGYACRPGILPPSRKLGIICTSSLEGTNHRIQRICSILDTLASG